MKTLFTIGILLFLTCEIFAQEQSNTVKHKSQQFIIPEELWKSNECQGTFQNTVVMRLPADNNTLSLTLMKSSGDTSVSIMTGNLCDMVKGYNNSSFYIGTLKLLIKPCEGSHEQDIEIASQGIDFIYHMGVGLEYLKGSGTIKMNGKTYELPIDDWKIAVNDSSIKGYKDYIKNNPLGEHIQEANSKIEELSYLKCLKDDRYYAYNQFVTDFPTSKNIVAIKNKLALYKKIKFVKDTTISEKVFVQKYHWNSVEKLSIIDEVKGFGLPVMNGRTWASDNFALGNLEFINALMTRVEGGFFIVKGTELIYKIPPKTNPSPNPQSKPIKK